jgi:hypothetical protein
MAKKNGSDCMNAQEELRDHRFLGNCSEGWSSQNDQGAVGQVGRKRRFTHAGDPGQPSKKIAPPSQDPNGK